MAEMLIQSESLTSIADKIRVLSGTSSAMGLDAMATHVNTANSNVSTESGLIAQIQSALEGKAAGSGSSEIKLQEKTVTPTTSPQKIIPDEGYDGLSAVYINEDWDLVSDNIVEGVEIFGVVGTAKLGDNMKTCTVELDTSNLSMGSVYSVHYFDQYGYRNILVEGATTTITNVLVNSIIVFESDSYVGVDSAVTNQTAMMEKISDSGTSTPGVIIKQDAYGAIIKLKAFDIF